MAGRRRETVTKYEQFQAEIQTILEEALAVITKGCQKVNCGGALCKDCKLRKVSKLMEQLTGTK